MVNAWEARMNGDYTPAYVFIPFIQENDNTLTDFSLLDRTNSAKSPRLMTIGPYFMMQFGSAGSTSIFNYKNPVYIPTYTYDYIINLELDEVHELDRVEIEPYVLDLHNKRRRDNVK
jgi:hypothetical protein